MDENAQFIQSVQPVQSGKPDKQQVEKIFVNNVVVGESITFSRACERCDKLIEFHGNVRSYSHRRYCDSCALIKAYESHRSRNAKYRDNKRGIKTFNSVVDARRDANNSSPVPPPPPSLLHKINRFFNNTGEKTVEETGEKTVQDARRDV